MNRSSACGAFVSIAIFLGSGAGVAAQSEDPHDTLINLDMLQISKDLCGFAITDAQADVISSQIEQITEALNMSDDQSQKLYVQLHEQMTRQKPAGLCAPKGAWAKLFAKLLAALPAAPAPSP